MQKGNLVLGPIYVGEAEAAQALQDISGLETCLKAQILVRWHGVPIGWVHLPVRNGRITAERLKRAITDRLSWDILRQGLVNTVAAGKAGLPPAAMLDVKPVRPSKLPKVSVAVCTRDRPDDLALCLSAILKLKGPVAEVVIIDNASKTGAVKELVEKTAARSDLPFEVRYVREDRPGLDWARNRAILESRSEIIAFTDDDVVVDPNWALAIAEAFAGDPDLSAVTGLVVPYELETDAQIMFELNGGFSRGFERKRLHFPDAEHMPWYDFGTGKLGTGANMAFRRSDFAEIGVFDPALDVGTPTNGAGDLEMFFRVLFNGKALAYEPSAMVWHRHRRDFATLKRQIGDNGSVFAMIARSVSQSPDSFGRFLRLGRSWAWTGIFRPAIRGMVAPRTLPAELYGAHLRGALRGPSSYFRSKKLAQQIALRSGASPVQAAPVAAGSSAGDADRRPAGECAVRTIDLADYNGLPDIAAYNWAKAYVTYAGVLLGPVDIVNHYHAVSPVRLAEKIVQDLNGKMLCLHADDGAEPQRHGAHWSEAYAAVADRIGRPARRRAATAPARDAGGAEALSADQSVSIVIGTFDRPDDLRACLKSLLAQETPREVEIIVADNHPASGITALVTSEFPTVRRVEEPRQGVAYARNAGIVASRGDIIVTIDDDVEVPAGWLERLIAPFARRDVLGVTGNVLPYELKTESQQKFEAYGNGGLVRGFYRFEVDRAWFDSFGLNSVQTWNLGGTANSAYRAEVFADPDVGLMEESLGPGMPSGVGEDIYLFYRILKAGGTILYEPTAYLWHKHRRTMDALRRQIWGYSKGFTSYQLTTLFRDRDFRALLNLFVYLPKFRLGQVWRWVRGDRSYPMKLIALEWYGNFAGYPALWKSLRRVKKMGRSGPYRRPVAHVPAPAEAGVVMQPAE